MADSRPIIPAGERGAALLTVLMLVAVMAVITAVALERLTLATRMAQNGVSADQGRSFLMAGEAVAASRLADLVRAQPGRTTLAGGWLGTAQSFPVPGGMVIGRVRDSGNCFNINGLVSVSDSESYQARPQGITQFSALLRLLGTDPRVAEQIAVASADWIDTNAVPGPGGAEDATYGQMGTPYRTAGGLLIDASEIRTVAGMTAPIYERVRPWLCALPVAELSPINVNTLLPDQAILLSMVADGRIGAETARQMIARRPVEGYASLPAFWAPLAQLGLPPEAAGQAKLTSRWFEVDLTVDLGGTDVRETVLFDAQDRPDAPGAPARLVRRRWGDEG